MNYSIVPSQVTYIVLPAPATGNVVQLASQMSTIALVQPTSTHGIHSMLAEVPPVNEIPRSDEHHKAVAEILACRGDLSRWEALELLEGVSVCAVLSIYETELCNVASRLLT